MTLRQIALKLAYPLIMLLKPANRSIVLKNEKKLLPPISVYNISVELNSDELFSLSTYKGKKILVVNTASDCVFTDQYRDLENIYQEHKDSLMIIGFPANDFREQEKGTDKEIAGFCKVNYGVSFLIAKKSSVTGKQKNELFDWLTDKNKNGWNDHEPDWNFSKYLIDEDGVLIGYYGPAIAPKTITAV